MRLSHLHFKTTNYVIFVEKKNYTVLFFIYSKEKKSIANHTTFFVCF